MLFDEIAALVCTTALFSWLNRRFFNLPNNVALLTMGIAVALALLMLDFVLPGQPLAHTVGRSLNRIDFYKAVMQWMLAFLLFAGAVTSDWNRLRNRGAVILLLASFGVVVSALGVGFLFWLAMRLFDVPVNFAWCFVFGALIAPTDPVAALATLSAVKLPRQIETEIEGEALFNDGIAVVVFTVALQFASNSVSDPALADIGLLLLKEAAGGAILGIVTGYLAFHAFNTVNDYADEVLFSLALVMGTYAAAQILGASGPISVVVAGILIGNRGAPQAMSEETRTYFFGFWRLVDHMFNGILFTLLGLEVLVLNLKSSLLLSGLIAIPIVLVIRLFAIGGTVVTLKPWFGFDKGTVAILTWSAVRGAISAALALSLPEMAARPAILSATYAVILFSVIVQSLSLPRLVRHIID
ncbi:sodium:proton antiporter [Allorhizobium sp. BGMRC 0089]|uniref:cation:proton antiporter n=1 Tax=Allorhizobium sonneratiae TaxID=2934936 RepID=UPI002033E295|nr:sodium:proton antiporter [Allorhizobium sonneratiae]